MIDASTEVLLMEQFMKDLVRDSSLKSAAAAFGNDFSAKSVFDFDRNPCAEDPEDSSDGESSNSNSNSNSSNSNSNSNSNSKTTNKAFSNDTIIDSTDDTFDVNSPLNSLNNVVLVSDNARVFAKARPKKSRDILTSASWHSSSEMRKIHTANARWGGDSTTSPPMSSRQNKAFGSSLLSSSNHTRSTTKYDTANTGSTTTKKFQTIRRQTSDSCLTVPTRSWMLQQQRPQPHHNQRLGPPSLPERRRTSDSATKGPGPPSMPRRRRTSDEKQQDKPISFHRRQQQKRIPSQPPLSEDDSYHDNSSYNSFSSFSSADEDYFEPLATSTGRVTSKRMPMPPLKTFSNESSDSNESFGKYINSNINYRKIPKTLVAAQRLSGGDIPSSLHLPNEGLLSPAATVFDDLLPSRFQASVSEQQQQQQNIKAPSRPGCYRSYSTSAVPTSRQSYRSSSAASNNNNNISGSNRNSTFHYNSNSSGSTTDRSKERFGGLARMHKNSVADLPSSMRSKNGPRLGKSRSSRSSGSRLSTRTIRTSGGDERTLEMSSYHGESGKRNHQNASLALGRSSYHGEHQATARSNSSRSLARSSSDDSGDSMSALRLALGDMAPQRRSTTRQTSGGLRRTKGTR